MKDEGARFFNYLHRGRDLLISYGDPRPLHRGLELHLLSVGAAYDHFALEVLKDGLSALALYMISRPRFETFGWTSTLRAPHLDLFFSGSTVESTVMGRAFSTGLRPTESSLFVVQTTRPFGDLYTSSVEVEGLDVFDMVEQFCRTSDQQPVRFAHRGEDRIAILCSLPEADHDWMKKVDAEAVIQLEQSSDLKLISEYSVSFRCGCDLDRITRITAEAYAGNPAELFQEDAAVEVECPRCGTSHRITKEAFRKIDG